jgi:anaerobic magnesium-protoporphyrin IX monomethyl ester cyclase
MHFVFVQPPIGKRVVSVSPALSIPYLAAIVEAKQIKVSVIISDAEGLNVDQTAERVVKLNPDVVGFSIGTVAAFNSYDIARLIKEQVAGVITIAGGHHATIFPEEVLCNGIDFVAIGEGEKTIGEFSDYLLGERIIEEVRGIAYCIEDGIKYNEAQSPIDNLDNLPMPAWHLMPIEKFSSNFQKTSKNLPIMTSRGCPGQCIFCFKGLFGSKFRMRSAKSIVSEILYLKEKFGINSFDIIDDHFAANPKRAIEVCSLIKKNSIHLAWGLPSGIRVDVVSEELLKALKEAGCYRIGFGVESGNDQILRIIKKYTTKDQIFKAVRLAQKLNFETYCFFIIGNLGETEQTIDDTIKFALELDPDIAQFTVAIPYPGTEMFQVLQQQSRICSYDWNDYDYFKSGRQVFEHEHLKYDVIQKKYSEAYKRFYLRPKFIIKKFKTLKNFEEISRLLKSFLNFVGLFKS